VSEARFEIRSSWDGGPLLESEAAHVTVAIDGARRCLRLRVEATDYGDPAPRAAAGSVDGLWEYEVVELFLVGEGERYLEIELGPHGHYLGLLLDGRRRIVRRHLPIGYRTERLDDRWRGEAELGLEWLPENVRSANAYGIHGVGPARRHLAAYPVPGPEPDFHRLECFAPFTIDVHERERAVSSGGSSND